MIEVNWVLIGYLGLLLTRFGLFLSSTGPATR